MMRLFAASLFAECALPSLIVHTAYAVEAESMAKARAAAYLKAVERWPISKGFRNHGIEVLDITELRQVTP